MKRITEFGRGFDRFLVLLISIVLAVGVIEHYTVTSRANKLARQGAQAHDAICTLRGDLERRVAASRAFLKDHPQGIPGIPAATLVNSIVNQEQTVHALSVIDCT